MSGSRTSSSSRVATTCCATASTTSPLRCRRRFGCSALSNARSTGDHGPMKNKIEDLRNHLFAALEGLSDRENPMELDRARAIADVGRVLVDSAKAEVAFISATGGRG